MFSFTQAAADNDDFFGGSGDNDESPSSLNKFGKRDMSKQRACSPSKRKKVEVEWFDQSGWTSKSHSQQKK